MFDFKNAFFSYNLLFFISDFNDNMKLKLNTLKNLISLCISMKKYDSALRICKRALEYSWLLGLEREELETYDRIGYIYYLKENIEKAKYYHKRFFFLIK